MKPTIDYLIASDSFVLPDNGEFTPEFWANELTKRYIEAGVKPSPIISKIREIKGIIVRNNRRTYVKDA